MIICKNHNQEILNIGSQEGAPTLNSLNRSLLIITHLFTDMLVLVEVKIKHIDSTISSHQGEHCAGVRSPAHVIDQVTALVAHDGLVQVLVPEVDSLLGGAGEEEAGEELVPHDVVDWGDVRGVGHDVGGAVLGAHQVDEPLFSSYQIQRGIIRLECESSDSISQVNLGLEVLQLFVEVDHQEVGEPERGLHDRPVCHSPVSRAAVEVHVTIKIVFGPVNLVNQLISININYILITTFHTRDARLQIYLR